PDFFAGTARFDSDARLGAGGDVLLDGGTAYLDGNWTTSRNIVLGDNTAINTNGFAATLNSGVQLNPGAGTALNKNGAGTLVVTGGSGVRFVANHGTVALSGANGSTSCN